MNFDGASLAGKMIFAERVPQPEKAPQILQPTRNRNDFEKPPAQAFLAENLWSGRGGDDFGAGLGR